MTYRNYFKDMFESVLDYRKIVLLIFSIKNDVEILKECGFLNSDIIGISLEFKNIYLNKMKII